MLKKLLKKWTLTAVLGFIFLQSILLCLWDFKTNATCLLAVEVQSYISDIVEQSASTLKSNMDFLTDRLEIQARIFALQGKMTDTEILNELKLFAQNENITRATIVKPDGKVYSSEFGMQAVEPGSCLGGFDQEKPAIHEPRVFADGQRLIDISIPVTINGEKFGVLSISYDRNHLQRIFSVPFLEGDCSINLVTADGTLIGRISEREAPEFFEDNFLEFYHRTSVAFSEGSHAKMREDFSLMLPGTVRYQIDGHSYSASYAPAGVHNWFIAAVASDHSVQTQAQALEKLASLLLVKIMLILSVAFILIVAYYMRQRRTLNQLKDSYRLALKKSNDFFYEIDLENDSYVDHSTKPQLLLSGIVGCKYSEFIQRFSTLCAAEDQADFLKQFLPENLEKLIADKVSVLYFEYKTSTADSLHWFAGSLIPVVEGPHPIRKIIRIENDISAQKKATANLKKAAQLDVLTALYNRAAAQSRIEHFLENEGKDGKHALLMLDIDFFKDINDQFGHIKGDAVLCQCGQVLQRVFRRSDILGRLGGDEFIIFLKDYTDISQVQAKAEQLNEAIRTISVSSTSSSLRSSASIGIALYKQDGDSFDLLYQNADAALYASKDKGKDCFTFFQEELPLS